jgi:RimJ/RimL family protein N-acetyltransferase
LQAVIDHLVSAYGVAHLLATVEAENERSIRLLERLGFRAAAPEEAERHALSPTERLYLRDLEREAEAAQPRHRRSGRSAGHGA